MVLILLSAKQAEISKTICFWRLWALADFGQDTNNIWQTVPWNVCSSVAEARRCRRKRRNPSPSSASFSPSHLHHYKVDISAENCWVSFQSSASCLCWLGKADLSLLYSFSSHTASCINEQLGPNNRCEQKNVVMCVTCFLLFALFLYFKLEVAEAWQGWTYIQLVIFPPILCCLHTAVPTFKNSRKWRCGN